MPRGSHSYDSDGLTLSINSAVTVLSIVKDAADAVPPLKVAASVTLSLLESVQVKRNVPRDDSASVIPGNSNFDPTRVTGFHLEIWLHGEWVSSRIA
jgi:hypothetical protein